MIDKMSDSIFESMLPLTIEQLSSSPLINFFLNDEEEDKGPKDYLMPSDDQWKKFEIDFPELSDIDIDDVFKERPKYFDSGVGDSSWELPSMVEDNKDCLLFNHDCMWAGFCASKEHNEEPRSSLCSIVPKPPVIKPEPVIPKTYNSQQSLLKPSVKAGSMISSTTSLLAPTCSNSSPQNCQRTPLTPPESDDEENKANTNRLLKLLNDAINECDLAEYLGKEVVEVKSEPPMEIKQEILDIKEEEEIEEDPVDEDTESEQDEIEYRIRTQLAAENDHSYYKDKNAVMSHNNYGLDTPSDSEEEEEIDVVSVNEKFTNVSRIALSLPTNPSTKDRHQLQRRVATAMSKKRSQNSGIKTILPVRSSDVSATSSSSSRRGMKRGRGSRNNNNYKRRRANTLEENEPSDKRHLHNDMERQRRVDLRIAFDNLKAVVPEVSGTKKIAKVNILLQAAQFCYYLTGSSVNYMKQIDELRRRQVWLRSRVSQLRRNLAAKR